MATMYVRNADGVFERVTAGSITVDTTLSVPGKPADAAAVGAALDNCAPTGYGLGESARQVSGSDIEQFGGFIYTEDVEPDYGYWGYQTAYGNYGTQLVTSLDNRMAVRFKHANVWGDWQYMNPRMATGVEYLTAEKYLGKPVYAKAINYGALGTAGTIVRIPLDVSGTIDELVDFTLIATKADTNRAYKFPWYAWADGSIQIVGYFDKSAKTFEFKCIGDQSDKTAVLTAKYTKVE